MFCIQGQSRSVLIDERFKWSANERKTDSVENAVCVFLCLSPHQACLLQHKSRFSTRRAKTVATQ